MIYRRMLVDIVFCVVCALFWSGYASAESMRMAGSASAAPLVPAGSDAGFPVTPPCDAVCLEALADRYLVALEARNPSLEDT